MADQRHPVVRAVYSLVIWQCCRGHESIPMFRPISMKQLVVPPAAVVSVVSRELLPLHSLSQWVRWWRQLLTLYSLSQWVTWMRLNPSWMRWPWLRCQWWTSSCCRWIAVVTLCTTSYPRGTGQRAVVVCVLNLLRSASSCCLWCCRIVSCAIVSQNMLPCCFWSM